MIQPLNNNQRTALYTGAGLGAGAIAGGIIGYFTKPYMKGNSVTDEFVYKAIDNSVGELVEEQKKLLAGVKQIWETGSIDGISDDMLKQIGEDDNVDLKALSVEERKTFADKFVKEGFEEFKPIEFNEENLQTMETYKKAYDENEEEKQTWEEVDYYAPPTDEPVVVDSKQTIYVTQTLRSGQVLEFDGNVVIIGDCHPGSEIKATGDITVWGVLGSIAHAGAKGNRDAKIRALKMNAVQLRIADCYSRRPDGTNIPYIIKSSVFTPEEARIVDDSIVLFKIN